VGRVRRWEEDDEEARKKEGRAGCDLGGRAVVVVMGGGRDVVVSWGVGI
jgi:hypothetical protein